MRPVYLALIALVVGIGAAAAHAPHLHQRQHQHHAHGPLRETPSILAPAPIHRRAAGNFPAGANATRKAVVDTDSIIVNPTSTVLSAGAAAATPTSSDAANATSLGDQQDDQGGFLGFYNSDNRFRPLAIVITCLVAFLVVLGLIGALQRIAHMDRFADKRDYTVPAATPFGTRPRGKGFRPLTGESASDDGNSSVGSSSKDQSMREVERARRSPSPLPRVARTPSPAGPPRRPHAQPPVVAVPRLPPSASSSASSQHRHNHRPGITPPRAAHPPRPTPQHQHRGYAPSPSPTPPRPMYASPDAMSMGGSPTPPTTIRFLGNMPRSPR